ncbi:MAG: hypothetical protein ABWJ90_10665 [Thermus sp.]|uniref:hypothetical protein n=1 Tax=Thermus sp. TaxID=275 RepID=UPI0031FAD94D
MGEEVRVLGRYRELAERGLDVLGQEGGDRLREMRAFYAFLEQELPRLLARFEEEP